MFELRAAVGGIVLSVEVIEGQTVAELDDICALDSDQGRVLLATQVPGVVRELYVPNDERVRPTRATSIALIDEATLSSSTAAAARGTRRTRTAPRGTAPRR